MTILCLTFGRKNIGLTVLIVSRSELKFIEMIFIIIFNQYFMNHTTRRKMTFLTEGQ